MRIVVDTNVLISGMFWGEGPPRQIIQAWLTGKITVIATREILDEYRGVTARLSKGSRNNNFPFGTSHLGATFERCSLTKPSTYRRICLGFCSLGSFKSDPNLRAKTGSYYCASPKKKKTDVSKLLKRLLMLVHFILPTELPSPICRDRDDDKFIAAAFSGRARYLVTGDADLLRVQRYRRVKVISPSSYSRILR